MSAAVGTIDVACSANYSAWITLRNFLWTSLADFKQRDKLVIMYHIADTAACGHDGDIQMHMKTQAMDNCWRVKIEHLPSPRITDDCVRVSQFVIDYRLCSKDGNIMEFIRHVATEAVALAEDAKHIEAVSLQTESIAEQVCNVKQKEMQWILKKELGLW